MPNLSRRESLQVLAAASFAGAFTWTRVEAEDAWHRVAHRAQDQPRFFTPHEWRTVRVLADLIVPRDTRSGSASDAGVPQFIDFLMADGDNTRRQTAMRGGLAWIDTQCRERFDRNFVACSDAERTSLLGLIAWPAQAPPELSHGVEFFNSLRNLTASGFWSSKMGIADLRYLGNTTVSEWRGCPQAQLDRLGVRYDD